MSEFNEEKGYKWIRSIKILELENRQHQKHIILLSPFLLFPECPQWPLNSKWFRSYTNKNAIMYRRFNLGFQNFKAITTHKMKFCVKEFFSKSSHQLVTLHICWKNPSLKTSYFFISCNIFFSINGYLFE